MSFEDYFSNFTSFGGNYSSFGGNYWSEEFSSTFSDFTGRAQFALGRLREAELSGVAYQVVPVALGIISGGWGVKTLAQAAMGFDGAQYKRAWREQALSGKSEDDQQLTFEERCDLYLKGVFGSATLQARSGLIAKAVVAMIASAALIIPFFAKNLSHETNYEIIKQHKFDLVDNEHRAHYNGAPQENYLYQYQRFFGGEPQKGGPGNLQRLIRALDNNEIDKNAQLAVSQILGTPDFDEKSLNQAWQETRFMACDWSAGWFNNQTCLNLKPTPQKLLFYKMTNGETGVHFDVAQDRCNATRLMIEEDGVLSTPHKTQRFVESVCEVFKTKDNDTFAGVSYARALYKGCLNITGNNMLFEQPRPYREDLHKITDSICTALDQRRMFNLISKPENQTSAVTADKESALLPFAKLINGLTTKEPGSKESLLEEATHKNPTKVCNLARQFFGLNSDAINETVVHRQYRNAQRKYNPDKCMHNYKDDADAREVCQLNRGNISTAMNALKELFSSKGGNTPINCESTGTFYSPLEKVIQAFNFFTP